MSNLVGLGEACWIEQIECNRHECHITPRSLLAEVVAIDSAAVHLLPFDRLDGIGVGARVVVARD